MRSSPARPDDAAAPASGSRGTAASAVVLRFLAAAAVVGIGSAGAVATFMPPSGLAGPVLALVVMAAVGGFGAAALRHGHPHARLGMANLVTLVRAGIAAVLTAALLHPALPPDTLAWGLVALACLGLALDGVDGWLARRSGLASDFGARFDMEVDAFLAAVLCLVALTWDKAGPWILPLGFLRYAWVLAGLGLPWLTGALPDRAGRKTACVVQIAVLAALMAPPLVPPLSGWLAAGGLAVLVLSFAVDAVWLWRRR